MTETLQQAGLRSAGNVPRSHASAPSQVRAPRIPAILRFTIILALASTLMLGRFQLNIGSYFLSVGLIAQYLVVLVLLLLGLARIDPMRMFLFIGCAGVALVSWVVNAEIASSSSVLLIVAAYLVFVFVARSTDRTQYIARWTLGVFLNLMLFCAIAGIAQFFLQFVVKWPWLFNFTDYIPEMFRGGVGYNTVIRVSGHFTKSNGFFFVEPSRFSQVLALALLCELALHPKWRWIRLATLGLAILLSYSGTGLLTLGVGLLFPLGPRTVMRLIIMLLGGAFVFFVFGDALNLSVTAGRVGEFTSVGSSGFARFVAPFLFVRDYIDSTPWSLLIGHGPGSIFKVIASSDVGYEVAGPTWAKLATEYGVLGFAAFTGLILYTMVGSRVPTELRVGIIFGWFILWGGVLLAPDVTALFYILVALWPRQYGPVRAPLPPPVPHAGNFSSADNIRPAGRLR
ncbi:hypothetical protein [Dongia sp. agr-C8]